MRNARRATQALFLLIFLWLFLQTEAKGANQLGYPVKVFLDADPLLFITTLFAAHTVSGAFYLAVIVIIATIVLGRVFCGWICPLGTVHNMVGILGQKRHRTPSWNRHYLKYLILIVLLVASLLSVQVAGIVDPLSLLIRSLALAVYPMLNYAAEATYDAFYAWHPPILFPLGEALYGIVKKFILAFQQPYFRQSFFVGVLFAGVLGLNLMERRFWCKYLCPLGALLGIFSRYALLKRTVSEGCEGCGACMHSCSGGAVAGGGKNWRSTECICCLDCDDTCPQGAVHFGFAKENTNAALDIGKRRVLGSLIAGLIAVPLLRTTPLTKAGASDPALIRPPGALAEGEFLKRCIRCGECMKVCITNGLQPALLEAGLEGFWTPLLVPRIGYCEYHCTLCGQVCPTGAIGHLNLREKAEIKIGLAMIDKGRCLPYAQGIPCLVCEEVCPTPKKAIRLEEVRTRSRQGATVVKQPNVDLDLCIGCGICEARCPIPGRPAIYVISAGESRSKDNQILL